MRCEAQSVRRGTATQAIRNQAARPNLAEQMCKLLLNEPLVGVMRDKELTRALNSPPPIRSTASQ